MIVPGARAAVKVTTAGRIGVVATEGTVASGAYDAAIHQQNSALTVHSMAAPKFVSLVESNEYKSDLARRVVADTLAPLAAEHPDTVIMGCTHYPLLRPFIQAALGDDVTLIDPGRETVVELATVLDYLGLANRGDHDGDRSFYTTASPTMFADIASDWLGLDDLHAQHVNIEANRTTLFRMPSSMGRWTKLPSPGSHRRWSSPRRIRVRCASSLISLLPAVSRFVVWRILMICIPLTRPAPPSLKTPG